MVAKCSLIGCYLLGSWAQPNNLKPPAHQSTAFTFPLIDRFWRTLQLALGTSTVRGGFRDVKPDNLTVLDGVVRVLDFGQSAPKHSVVEWKGTVGFRSPVPRPIITQRGCGKKENYNLHVPDANMPWRCLGACLGGTRHVILQTWFESHFSYVVASLTTIN